MLIVVKFVARDSSGSVAILASAIDSLLQFMRLKLLISMLSQRQRITDVKFNYGLGKIDGLQHHKKSSVIIYSGVFIIYQSVKKLMLGERASAP